MKKIVYIFAFLLSVTLLSCDGDVEHTIYGGPSGFSFAGAAQNESIKDGDKLLVPVYRGSADTAAVLPLEIEIVAADAAVIGLKDSKITFPKGEFVAYAEIDFGKVTDLGVTTTYNVNLSFDEKYASPSATSSINVIFKRELTYKEFGSGSVTSGWAIAQEWATTTWTQKILLAEEAPVVSLPDYYGKGTSIAFLMDDKLENVVKFDTQLSGEVHPSYGKITVTYVSSYREGKDLHLTLKYTVSAGSFGSFEEIITFP